MCFSFSLRVTLCPDFLSHLFQSLSQQNIRPSTASSTAAAKAVAPSPSGKGTKTPAVPPLCRVPESSGSSTVVGEVTAGEMNVGSSPGERWADGVGVLEPEAGAASPAVGACSGRRWGSRDCSIFQPLLSHWKESGAVCLATAPCFTCGSGGKQVLCALRESFWALFDVMWN